MSSDQGAVTTKRRMGRGAIALSCVALSSLAVVAGAWVASRSGGDTRDAVEVIVTTTAAPPSSAPPPTTTTAAPPTTTTEPPDPYESLVATVEPRIEILETFAEPDDSTPVAFEFAITNPTYFGSVQTLLVVEGEAGDEWLRVQIPVRPNHTTAWIRADDVTLSTHTFHGVVDVSDRLVRFYDRDELVAETNVVVGRDSTPTPLGRFYVNEVLPQSNPGGAYGPFIFALSAFSETLDTFNGGIPVIALHGTNHPELIGQARSNGCVRMPNEIAELLAATIPAGTPVEIVA